MFALAVSRGLQQTLIGDLVLQNDFGIILNARVLAVYGIMLFAVSLLSGIAPMRRLVGTSLVKVLAGARQGEKRAVNLRELLVVVQVGVSTVLLTTAISFAGTLLDTLKIDPGFAIENHAVSLISTGSTVEDSPAVYRQVLRNLRADGRVVSAALAEVVPVSQSGFRIGGLAPQGYIPAADENIVIDVNSVSEDYFRTLGIELLNGRDFDARDFSEDGDGPMTANVIVNRAFVDTYWPERAPLGLTIGDTAGTRLTVVGVVENNKQRSLREPPLPVIYVPFTQLLIREMNVVVHATSSDIALQAIRDAIRGTDAGLLSGTGMSLRERLDVFTAPDRALTLLVAGAAIFATLLAVVGMYSVAAYAARQRQREIGIRYALGATRPQVARQFLRRGVIVATGGIVGGLLLTVFVSRYLAGVIAGVERSNALAMLLAGLLFAIVALFANLVPVWRAADVAPMSVLRDE